MPLGYNNHTIVHLEILNIVVALKIWDDIWQDQVIEIKCDNMAVVEVLRSGKARDCGNLCNLILMPKTDW